MDTILKLQILKGLDNKIFDREEVNFLMLLVNKLSSIDEAIRILKIINFQEDGNKFVGIEEYGIFEHVIIGNSIVKKAKEIDIDTETLNRAIGEIE